MPAAKFVGQLPLLPFNKAACGQPLSASYLPRFAYTHRLVGLAVKASASRAEDPGFEIPLALGFFSGSSNTSDFKMGTLVATLPGAWRYRVSTGTGRPGVSIL